MKIFDTAKYVNDIKKLNNLNLYKDNMYKA